LPSEPRKLFCVFRAQYLRFIDNCSRRKILLILKIMLLLLLCAAAAAAAAAQLHPPKPVSSVDLAAFSEAPWGGDAALRPQEL
jgi:hypothetical protein